MRPLTWPTSPIKSSSFTLFYFLSKPAEAFICVPLEACRKENMEILLLQVLCTRRFRKFNKKNWDTSPTKYVLCPWFSGSELPTTSMRDPWLFQNDLVFHYSLAIFAMVKTNPSRWLIHPNTIFHLTTVKSQKSVQCHIRSHEITPLSKSVNCNYSC